MWASIIPGFRDSRTPLIAGVMWFLVIWPVLGAERLVPSPNGGAVEAELSQLIALAGPTATLALTALGAVLIGGLIPTISRTAAAWISRSAGVVWTGLLYRIPFVGLGGVLASGWFSPLSGAHRGYPGDDGLEVCYGIANDLSETDDLALWQEIERDPSAPRVLRHKIAELVGYAEDPNVGGRDTFGGDESNHEMFKQGVLTIDWRQAMVAHSIMDEFDDLAVLLHIEHESLFLEVDRLIAEADLRRGMFFPA